MFLINTIPKLLLILISIEKSVYASERHRFNTFCKKIGNTSIFVCLSPLVFKVLVTTSHFKKVHTLKISPKMINSWYLHDYFIWNYWWGSFQSDGTQSINKMSWVSTGKFWKTCENLVCTKMSWIGAKCTSGINCSCSANCQSGAGLGCN